MSDSGRTISRPEDERLMAGPTLEEIERHARLKAEREEAQASMRAEVAKFNDLIGPGQIQMLPSGVEYAPTTATVLTWMAVGFCSGFGLGSSLTTLLWVLLQK